MNVIALLKKEYPDVTGTALRHSNPLELLVATILSAQTTDVLVNKVTVKLFRKYTTVEEYANADLMELQNDIKSVNFYRNKGKFIKESCRIITVEFNGVVPDTMEDLIRLPGVNRKTANVVLSNVFGKVAGVVVDTHVLRLSQRLGLTKETQRERVEADLMKKFPKRQWVDLANMLITHGRRICKARNPLCNHCVLNAECPYFRKTIKKR